MRAGLSTIQQTLTPEAATVLNHSIAEAGRRNHSQTTPLHVAATLLAAPSGYLRQACIRSHPNSSHPLQCRALELCFSVALERLQTTAAGGGGGGEPPLSNALMAALKRAQAHQRRGCPEQQQQPLLAVKVELEQLIISILDDPSVSRVMREASFSSPAVKAAIEQSLQPCSAASVAINGGGAKIGMPFRPGPQPGPRNLYLNPRLQQQQQVNGNQIGAMNGDNVRRVIDILLRDKKRNPVLVGESEPEIVAKEVLKRVEKKELEVPLKEAEVVSMVKELGSDFSQMGVKVRELGGLIERRLMGFTAGGIVLDLGDLKWLVDPPGGGGALEVGRLVVAEIGKILKKYNDGGNGGTLWVMGTATCETYLRCQVYHPSMENEWDLQVVSIVARAPPPGMLSRLGPNGILSSSVECLSPLKSFPTIAPPLTRRVSENLDPSRSPSCCPQCLEKYEQEHTKLVAVLADKPEVKSEATRQSLPAWLQYAKLQNKDVNDGCDLSQSKDQDMILKQKTQELQKKWTETCFHLHPNFHHNSSSERIAITPLSLTGLYNPTLLGRQPLQPKLPQSGTLCGPRHLNIGLSTPSSPPGSPVRTDLVLGRTKPEETPARSRDLHVDADSFKRLLKGLIEKVWWQKEAATAVATTVVQCKSGNGNHRPGGSNGGDIWLLFSGPDRVGKKKMAAALSELVCGVAPVVISLGSRRDSEESDLSFRGKTAIDRIAEAVRRNPFSLIMLRDIDEADTLVRGSIKRAIEKGRLADSHGREISLGNIIFVVTTNEPPDEEKLESLATGCWRLRICLGEKTGKRQPSWILDEGRAIKHRKETGPSLSFDLNEMADIADDRLDGSHNSSDLTVDNDENRHGHHRENHHELAESVDGTVVFSPVDFDRIRRDIERKITTKFSTIMEDKLSIKIDHEALERILSGIFSGPIGLEAWTNNVLVPNIQKLKSSLPASAVSPTENPIVARLELYAENDTGHGEPLPSKIMVLVDGQ